MFSPKIHAIRIAIGGLVVLGIVLTAVVLGGGSSSTHPGGRYTSPPPAALGGKAKVQAPLATRSTPTQTETAPPAAANKRPPAGTPQANGGDSDPDNNGGPADADGAI